MGGAKEHLRESKNAMVDVFRNQSLRRLNLALAGSVIGDWAYAVAMSVYAYQRGGATAVGTLAVVRYVSMSLLAPFVAMLADKLDRRKLMIAADVIRGILVLSAAIVVFGGGPALAVYAIAIVTSWASLAFRPAQAALLPSLAASPAELTAANVSSLTIHSVGMFVGPSIAGLLLAVADVGWVFVFNAVSFVWSSLLVFRIHPPAIVPPPAQPVVAEGDGEEHAEQVPKKREGMFAGAGDGYRAILSNRDLRLMTGLYVAQTIVAGASVVFEVAIALDLLKLRDSGVGVLGVALGLGGIFGGVAALLLAQRGKLARDFGLGVVLWAAPLLLVSAWPNLTSALIAMALIGLGNSVVDVNAETILQRLVPDEVMGRVFGALDSAAIGGMAIGSLLMPILISTVGLRQGLVVIGVMVTLVVVLSIKGLSRIDDVALAPAGLELLRGVPMLAVLKENLTERLARTSKVFTFAAGDTVFREGDAGDRFYIIDRGTVEVTIRGEFVRLLGPGDSFGEIALLRDIPRTATVTATSELALRAIDRSHFLGAVTGQAEAAEQAELVVGRLVASYI